MRFRRLEIPAFGPFTDLRISFPGGEHDLHVIYGDNEAGKSSLLRAIRDLLFGIHGQSPDDFLHEYKKLRLVGEMENRAGAELLIQRRKGNKNTLLDREDNPLPESALGPFLGGVDAAYFSTMFGLGNRELHAGAEELLRGEGEIGSALFSASAGGASIRAVLDSLTGEADRLFKGRATTNVSIRPAVKRYNELLRHSRGSMVRPEEWEALEREMAGRESVRKELENGLARLGRELDWTLRVTDALPGVGRLTEEMRLLGELPELPELASDFLPRARLARETVREAGQAVQSALSQVRLLEEQLGRCNPSPALLAAGDALEGLHQQLGGYRTWKELLTGLRSKMGGIEPVLRAGMASLGLTGELDSLRRLRISSAARLACEESAKVLGASLRERDRNRDDAAAIRQKMDGLEVDLGGIEEADLTPLREALAIAAQATDADKTLPAARVEVENLAREMADGKVLVVGAPADPDLAAALSVPTSATVRAFRDRFDDVNRRIGVEEEAIRDAERSVAGSRKELKGLERRGGLPSEEALGSAREHRDRGWRLVLADWKGAGAGEDLVEGVPLEEAFPEAIRKADELADALRQQAEAVAQAEAIRARIEEGEQRIEAAKARRVELRGALEAGRAEWEAEWRASGLVPRSPGEMEEWREAWVTFRETLRRLRVAEAVVGTKTELVQRARVALAGATGDFAEKEFAVLYQGALRGIQRGEQLAGRRDVMVEQLQKCRAQLAEIELNNPRLLQAVSAATAEWERQGCAVGLPGGTSPDAGLILLDERRRLLERFDAWEELSGQALKLEEEVGGYEEEVDRRAVALEISRDTIEAREAGLWEALTQARKVQAQQDQLMRQSEEGKAALVLAEQARTQAGLRLEELMGLAKVSRAEELEPLLAGLEQREALRGRIQASREALGGLARGLVVDQFVARVQAENPEELPQRQIRLEAEREEKKLELQEAMEVLARLRNEKRRLEAAGDAAADFQQQAESVAAQLRQDAARFIRLRLAVQFLRTQVEQFRQQTQGPLLEKSGRLFAGITRGAFASLTTEVNSQDEQVLVGVRPGGSRVPVAGMSDGSRDQLYLSLRLAALGHYLDGHEPMPVILDDLLITFDDARAGAILRQLAGLSERTQILLFTHHEHLVDLCRRGLGEGRFHLHRLERASG